MEIIYSSDAIEDLKFWKKTGNKAFMKKITSIIISISETPFEGIGKPEPLKHNLAGQWSRRITQEHRIVYGVTSTHINIYSLKGHYK
jgi:toxin YoeB